MDWYAIDFGTSNSLLSYAEEGKEPELLNLNGSQAILKSLIFTPQKDFYFFGEEAIKKYQEYAGDGRFFRSLKKFLPEPSFKGTEVFGRKMKIEELVAIFLRELKKRSDEEIGKDVENVVLGRPALYSLDEEKDSLAQERMEKAALLAGFKRIEFCPEPVAAGLLIEEENKGKEKIVLVCDFGGGTSDFTLLKVGGNNFSKKDVLGLSGVFVAGDALDGRLMRNFISRELGRDITYKAPMGNNILSFPNKLLKKLSNPAHIVFLKERENWEFLKELEKWSLGGKDEKHLLQLFCLVEEQLGYPIYAEIEKTKIALGEEDKTQFSFKHPGIDISMGIERKDFEQSIESELSSIFKSLDEVFNQSGLKASQVEKVCITGGSGQMPLIRKRLEDIFGQERISFNEAFHSVGMGLGNYAKNLQEEA